MEEARSSLKSQAIQPVEESQRFFQVQATQMVEDIQISTRTEAMQYLEHFQSQAKRAISESQAQSIQLQKELEDTRAGTTQIVQDASKEIESAKSQAEAQSVVSSLEGKITELVRINGELSIKSVEQIKMINALTLTQRVDEQQSLLRKLQNKLAMSPTSRAADGTDVQMPLQLPVASGIGQSRLSRDSEMHLRTGGQTGHSSGSGSVASPVQDPHVQLFAMPSQHGDSPKDTQLKELFAKVESLASVVHGFASNQGGGRKSKGNDSNKGSPNPPKEYDIATPPKSPPGSSSPSSSKGSRGGGSGSPTPPRGSNASGISSSSNRSRVVNPYKYEKKIMRTKQYDHLKIPNLPKSASDARHLETRCLT